MKPFKSRWAKCSCAQKSVQSEIDAIRRNCGQTESGGCSTPIPGTSLCATITGEINSTEDGTMTKFRIRNMQDVGGCDTQFSEVLLRINTDKFDPVSPVSREINDKGEVIIGIPTTIYSKWDQNEDLNLEFIVQKKGQNIKYILEDDFSLKELKE